MLLVIAGRDDERIPSFDKSRARFEAGLKVQQNNVTEPDEQAATDELADRWQEFQPKLAEFRALTDHEAAQRYYLDELQPAFGKILSAADRIVSINQDAMVEKSDLADRFANTTNRALLLTALAALAIGATVSVGLTNRLLRPLSVLNQAVGRLGAGDFDVRAKVAGRDEIAQLADQFNAMAERLGEYRNSSLGELLLAQQAAQAAIDSIPDPVVLFSSEGGILKVNDAAAMLVQKTHAGQVDLLTTLPPNCARRSSKPARMSWKVKGRTFRGGSRMRSRRPIRGATSAGSCCGPLRSTSSGGGSPAPP